LQGNKYKYNINDLLCMNAHVGCPRVLSTDMDTETHIYVASIIMSQPTFRHHHAYR